QRQQHSNKSSHQKPTQSNGQNRRNNQQHHKQNQNNQGQRRLSYSNQQGNTYTEHSNKYHMQQQKEGIRGNEQGAYVVYNNKGCESNQRNSNNFDQNNNIQGNVHSHSHPSQPSPSHPHTPSLNEQKQHYNHNMFSTAPFQTQTPSIPPKRPYMPFHSEQRTPQMSTPSIQMNQRSNETDEPSTGRRKSNVGGGKSTNESNGSEEKQLLEQLRTNGNNGSGNNGRGNNTIHNHDNPSTHVHTNTYTNASPSLISSQTHPSSSAQGTNYTNHHKQMRPSLHTIQPAAYPSTHHPTPPIYFSPRSNPSTTSPSSAAPATSTTYVKPRYVSPSISYTQQEDMNNRNGDNGHGNGITGPNTNTGGKRKNVDNIGKKGSAGEKKNGILNNGGKASEKERNNNFENGVYGQRQYGQNENGRQQQMGSNTGGNKNKKKNQWSHNKHNNNQSNNYYNNVTQNKVNVASNHNSFAHDNHNDIVYIPTGSSPTFSCLQPSSSCIKYTRYPINNSVQADVNAPNASPSYEVSGVRYNGNDSQGIQKGDINHVKKQDRGNSRVTMNQRDVYSFGRRGNNVDNSNSNSAQSFCQQFAPGQHMSLHASSARNPIIDDAVNTSNNVSSDHQSVHTEDVFVNHTADSSRMASLAIGNGRRHNNNGQGNGDGNGNRSGRLNEHNNGNQPRGQGTEGKSKRRAKKNARNGSAQKNSIRRDESSTSQSSLHSNGNYISYSNNAIKKSAPYYNNNTGSNNFSKNISKNATNSPSYARSQPASLVMPTNNTQPFTTSSAYNNMTSNQFTYVQSSNSTSSNADLMSSNTVEMIGQALNQSYGRGGRGARNGGNRRATEQK
ncbi:18873_t:CDS:2, partial [Gigaspora rosea]